MAAMVEGASALAEEKKKEGNALFSAGKFAEAVAQYTEALALADEYPVKVLLLTNRAAANIGDKKYSEALRDAEEALKLDPSWLKAHYRKAAALEGLDRPDLVYYAWVDAAKNCEHSPALTKQHQLAEKKWLVHFRTPRLPVTSTEDMVGRFRLLTDRRERLSTLAHLWNEGSQAERLSFLDLLLSLIGGAGDNKREILGDLTADLMQPMPLDNYPDFPATRLQGWLDFFRSLPSADKTQAFQSIWFALNSKEQHEVIVDMRIFAAKVSGREDVVLALQEAQQRDDGEDIDYSYRQAFK